MTGPEPSADVQPGHDGVCVGDCHATRSAECPVGCWPHPAAPSPTPSVRQASPELGDPPSEPEVVDLFGDGPRPVVHSDQSWSETLEARGEPIEPPAEAQQDDERRSVYGWVLRPNDRDKAVAEGFLARMYEGMSDDAVLDYIAGALASERDAAVAARSSADTETLLPVRAEIIRQVREAAWSDGYAACRRGEQNHNPYRVAR